MLLLAALCPESNSCHLSCSPDRPHPVPCSQCCSSAQPSPRVCIICSVSLKCHWHCGGSAFNSHFQNQLCHLSWQMAFPVFGLSEAEKVSLPHLQYLILLMMRSCLRKLQCLGLLVFFSCKAITKKKNYY